MKRFRSVTDGGVDGDGARSWRCVRLRLRETLLLLVFAADSCWSLGAGDGAQVLETYTFGAAAATGAMMLEMNFRFEKCGDVVCERVN